MEYIAQSNMKIAGPDGALRLVAVGDPLPEFASWPFELRDAHLKNGTVEQVGGQDTANLTYDQGFVSMGPKPPVVALEALDELPVVATDPLDEPVDVVTGLACTVCDKTFDRPARLRKHMEKHV